MPQRILWATLLGISMLWVGCAQDVGDIDRTQPNKLSKDIFDSSDEWYMQQIVTAAPGTAVTAFVGMDNFPNTMDRVRFNVQERMLIVHRAHEDVLGINTIDAPIFTPDGTGVEEVVYDPGDFFGAPVASFRITGHFDVQRQYNAATGEQTNVITENPADRHWSEREFMRVDWTQNMAPHGMWRYPLIGVQSMSPINWYQAGNSQANPLYTECRDSNGNWVDCDPERLGVDQEVALLAVEGNYVVEADWLRCILTFGFPMMAGDCGPETIQVRTTFVKIDQEVAAGYKPRVYTDKELDLFGFYRVERCTFDRLYGCRDQGRVNLAGNIRIWEDYRDENGNEIPEAQRTAKPIVYYINDEMPPDLWDESVIIGKQYDAIFRDIVQAHQPEFDSPMYYVCANSLAQVEAVSAKLDACADENLCDDGMWLTNDNSFYTFIDDFGDLNKRVMTKREVLAELVRGYNDGHCIRPEKAKSIGDPRFHFINWHSTPVGMGGLLGYGPPSVDGLTGEIVASNANQYGGSLDRYAQSILDLVDLINGDLTPQEYGLAGQVEGYLREIETRFNLPRRYEDIQELEAERRADFQRKLDIARDRLAVHRDVRGLPQLEDMIQEIDVYGNNWDKLESTERGRTLAKQLLTPEVVVGFGMGLYGPNDEPNDDMINDLSPSTLLRAPRQHTIYDNLYRTAPGAVGPTVDLDRVNPWRDDDARINEFAMRNMYMVEFRDNELTGLAMQLKDRYAHIQDDNVRRLTMFYELRGMFFLSTGLHEVGHTLGLRHNFESHYDSMSYHPNYWKIRYENDARLGINHDDPTRGLTVADYSQRIREFAYSSIMDYGGSAASQNHGLGFYDRAALAYSYGNLIEVFKEGSEPVKFQTTHGVFGGDSVYALDFDNEVLTPTNTPITRWDDIDSVPLVDPGMDDMSTDDDVLLNEDALDQDLDFWHYSVLNLMFNPEGHNTTDVGNMDRMYEREFITLNDYAAGQREGGNARLRVPYRFCSDEYAGQTPFCNRFQEGSDFNEITDVIIEGYQENYFISNYRRGRSAFGLFVWPHALGLYARSFRPLSNIYKQWYIRLIELPLAWQVSNYGGALQQVGVEEGLRTILGTLATPHPGTYRWHEGEQQYRHVHQEAGFRCEVVDTEPEAGATVNRPLDLRFCGDFNNQPADERDYLDLPPSGQVRFRNGTFDFDSGYYYFVRWEVLSSFWDRLAAIWAITNPDAPFLGIDTASDVRGYNIPYYAFFDVELSRFFGGIMAQDYNQFAPVIAVRADGGAGASSEVDLEFQDVLGPQSVRSLYSDPSRYRIINPYDEDRGNRDFNDRIFTTANALAHFQVSYDQSFNHAAQIFLAGNGEGFEIPDTDGDGVSDPAEGSTDSDNNGIPAYADPNETVANFPEPSVETFTDPESNKTYVAVQYFNIDRSGRTIYTPNVEMIRNANAAKEEYLATGTNDALFEMRRLRQDLDIAMNTNAVFFDAFAPWWAAFLSPF